MEKFSFHVLGGEKIICTGGGKHIPLDAIKTWGNGYLSELSGKYDNDKNNLERVREVLFKRLAKIGRVEFAEMGDEADKIVDKMGYPFFTDIKYWRMFAAAVWLDATVSIIRNELGGKKYVYWLPKTKNYDEIEEIEKLANRIGVMTKHIAYTSMANRHMIKILKWALPLNWEKIWPEYTWEAMRNAWTVYAAELFSKAVETLYEKYFKAIEFLKEKGEVIE